MAEDCKNCLHYRSSYTEHPCNDCVRAFSGRQEDFYDSGTSSRIDIIGTNGNDGQHYLVEAVAREIAGPNADAALHGQSIGRKRWELHINQAIRIIELIEENKDASL